jgi:hypothetical protein
MMNTESRGYQLPEGLRALINASQMLQKESSPVVQTPMGPRPTVAGSVDQGLTQLAQRAAIGNQIQQQQQAAQQQAAQDPQKVAEMAAQMMQAQQPQPAQQGIAALPVNMNMAHGGIIGFAAGDEVPKPSEKTKEKLEDEEKASDRAAVEEILKSMPQGPEGVVPFPIVEAAQKTPPPQGISPMQGNLQQMQQQGPNPSPDLNALPQQPPQPMQRPPAVPQEPRPVGIAQAQRPTWDKAYEGVEAKIGNEPEEYAKKSADIETRRKAKIASQEDLTAQGIAEIQEAMRKRDEIHDRRSKDDDYLKFMAMLADVYRPGAGQIQQVNKQINDRDELHVNAHLLDLQAIGKLKDAKQARELGEFDRERDLLKQATELKTQRNKLLAESATNRLQPEAHMYGTDVMAATERERTHEMAKQRAEAVKDRDQNKILALRTTAMGKVEAAEKDIDEKFKTDPRVISYQGSQIGGKIPPAIEAAYKQAIEDRKKEREARVAPIQRQVDELDSMLKGGNFATNSFSQWGQMSVTPTKK